MSKPKSKGLTLEELRKYDGFEELEEKQLEEALDFIERFTEVLIHINNR